MAVSGYLSVRLEVTCSQVGTIGMLSDSRDTPDRSGGVTAGNRRGRPVAGPEPGRRPRSMRHKTPYERYFANNLTRQSRMRGMRGMTATVQVPHREIAQAAAEPGSVACRAVSPETPAGFMTA